MSRSWGPEFDRFLRAVLPDLGLDWRRHRRRVSRRRVADRLMDLNLRSLDEYQILLKKSEEERARLIGLLGVTISRFFREVHLFQYLSERVWQKWNNQRQAVMFSAGCACGEEPYTLALSWREHGPSGVKPVILAMEIGAEPLLRARAGRYSAGSLREVPEEYWKYFRPCGREYQLTDEIKRMVQFYRADLLVSGPPSGPDLILCRNLAYTYFQKQLQDRVTELFTRALKPGGYLAVGAKERPRLPAVFEMVHPCLYQKTRY